MESSAVPRPGEISGEGCHRPLVGGAFGLAALFLGGLEITVHSSRVLRKGHTAAVGGPLRWRFIWRTRLATMLVAGSMDSAGRQDTTATLRKTGQAG